MYHFFARYLSSLRKDSVELLVARIVCRHFAVGVYKHSTIATAKTIILDNSTGGVAGSMELFCRLEGVEAHYFMEQSFRFVEIDTDCG